MDITRRGFLGSLIGGIAAVAAVREFPFRTYFFPSHIEVVKAEEFEKVITAMAGRQFELCDWAGGPSRWVDVDLSRPFSLYGNIPKLKAHSRILNAPFSSGLNAKKIILTDS